MYKDLQKEVYNWLLEKNKVNENFTFSVRQKANKGAELNYFIGTEKSNYFSTTFWFIPVSYPGSSSDLINLVFDLRKEKIEFYIQFNQTKNPSNDQNKYDLILVQNIKNRLKNHFDHVYYSDDTAKMEFFGIYSTPKYESFDDLKDDLEKLLDKVIPAVDEEIVKIKKENPDFIAHRFSPTEQIKMLQKMEERFEKYKIIDDLTDDLFEEENDLIDIDFGRRSLAPFNQILYGPPGTGKTYNTINKAIEIANPEFDLTQDRNIVKSEYERLVNEGQIVFTTFHQSMTYEDFIEGIKPVIEENEDGAKSVVYEVKNGIFKEICKNAEKPPFEKLEVKKNYSFDDAFNDLVLEANEKLENNEQLFLPILTENLGLKIVGISDRGNLILKPIYSDDAKEYIVSYSRAEKLQQVFPDLSVIKNIDKEFRAVIGGSNSTAYWSVLNYINNKINSEKKSTSQNIALPPKPFVLIIDEINRGNVSQIFGELITLIEEDKRLGNNEELEVTLPYSKEKFGVPSNLHIIGTMNTADRSVEALDTALRRRFVFEEMLPKYELEELQQNLYGFSASDILKTINLRIEKLLDRDHQIGHAYFIHKNEITIIDSFYKNIIPLLQEYFFGDYGKIGLVLGKGFIQEDSDFKDNKIETSFFASFNYDNAEDFENRISYRVLGLNDKDFDFENAIKLLMNKK
ncbi:MULTISPECIES: McrB family protein [Empedobacter]|uniref:5-methylcytosine-specific restriction enzyme B n=2 Tax=Empedobacter TaxID=59734 RepID=A0A376GFB4_9FLAO|nr:MULTISPECIES: AAA family ATPase [Empedobacter]STD58580.1 5-methylcytosine-specific restriction enzyme B [Empedobacter falsenii]